MRVGLLNFHKYILDLDMASKNRSEVYICSLKNTESNLYYLFFFESPFFCVDIFSDEFSTDGISPFEFLDGLTTF